MADSALNGVIHSVPAGSWAVGVSGGADSVALLTLLHARSDLSLHVVHLNHETRGEETEQDARFVAQLAQNLNLSCTIARRSEIEPGLTDPPANQSAKYRACRLALFGQVVGKHQLKGVILAHHADDQAETVLHRLLRGSGYSGLCGMSLRSQVGSLLIVRPLLSVRREKLRTYLQERSISWREDASNQSDEYLRNRIRKILAQHPELVQEMLNLSQAAAALRDWVQSAAPVLPEQINRFELAELPRILAEESAKSWLIAQGVPPDQLDPQAIERLLQMAADAATAPAIDFAGGVHVRRRGKSITNTTVKE